MRLRRISVFQVTVADLQRILVSHG